RQWIFGKDSGRPGNVLKHAFVNARVVANTIQTGDSPGIRLLGRHFHNGPSHNVRDDAGKLGFTPEVSEQVATRYHAAPGRCRAAVTVITRCHPDVTHCSRDLTSYPEVRTETVYKFSNNRVIEDFFINADGVAFWCCRFWCRRRPFFRLGIAGCFYFALL